MLASPAAASPVGEKIGAVGGLGKSRANVGGVADAHMGTLVRWKEASQGSGDPGWQQYWLPQLLGLFEQLG